MPGDEGLKEHMLNAAAAAGIVAPHKSTVEPEPPAETPPEAPPPEVKEPAEEKKEEKKEESKGSPFDALAKEWGHTSKEEFEADPNNAGKAWVDAETFVRNMKPISDAHRKKEREKERQLNDLTEVTKKLLEKQEAAERRIAEADKRAKEKLLEDLNEQLDSATDDGNKEAVRNLVNRIATLQGEINTTPAPNTTSQGPQEGNDDIAPASKSPTVNRWMGRNEKTEDNPNGWYGDTDDPINAALTLFADKRSAELGKDEAGNPRTWQEIFSILDAEVARKRETLQARIAPPKVTPASSSAGGGTPPASSSGGANDLTDAERRAGMQFVKRGLFKNLTEYAKALKSAS